MQAIASPSISLKMKSFLVIFFVAAVAQAIDVDWGTVDRMEVLPKNIFPRFEEAIRHIKPEVGSRIVGGQEAKPGQFPYQVGLFISTSQGTAFCGGSILDKTWILTAAHCVDVATEVEVRVGAHNIQVPDQGQISIRADKFIVHSGWNPSTLTKDIALVRLSQPLTFSDRVQPIRLPRRSEANTNLAGETGTVSGWGKPSDSANGISPTLLWTSNPIITKIACNIRYLGVITADHICVSGSGGRSSCSGDSGGPLVITESDGIVTQVGLVSFGISFGCEIGWPGVYTRVGSYLDWIAENTGNSIVIKE